MRTYRQTYTRENSLIAIQIWEEHQCRLIQEMFGLSIPFSVFDAHDGVARVFYDEHVAETWGEWIGNKAANDPLFIPGVTKMFERALDELEVIWRRGKVSSTAELKDLFELAAKAWVGVSITYFLPLLTGVSKESQMLGMDFRERSVDFLERTDHCIQNTLRDLYPELGGLVKYLTIKEATSGILPGFEILEDRGQHYIYFGFELYVGKDIHDLAQENDIVIEQENVPENPRELHGQTAMNGKAHGSVRVLRKKSEIPLLQEGEILVTAMTTPDYVPAMKKAAAIVTDEGGITCHAAIVAREFGKPCIIGTGIATKTLKTGNIVEVDADAGVIKII